MLSNHASHWQDEFHEDAIEQKEVEDMEETEDMEEGNQDDQNKEIHEEDREKEEEACSENMESFTWEGYTSLICNDQANGKFCQTFGVLHTVFVRKSQGWNFNFSGLFDMHPFFCLVPRWTWLSFGILM